MAFPAQNFEDAVSNAITSSDQLYNVINGLSTDVIATDSGDIPSLRKSLVDNFFFLDPIDWLQGENSTKFNQLYKFTDGLLWYAPAATVTNPIPLGASPNGDSNWLISPFSITTPVAPIQEPRQFGDGINDTFSTPSSVFVQPSSVIVRLDGIYQSSLDDYTIDITGNVVFTSGVPDVGVFVDITLYDPVVTENPSELNILSTGSTTPRMLKDRFAEVTNVKDFGAVGDGVADDTLAIQFAIDSTQEAFLPNGAYGTLPLEVTILGGGYLRGDGIYNSTLKAIFDNDYILSTGGIAGQNISQLLVDGDNRTGVSGIHFDNLFYGVVEGVDARQTSDIGYGLTNSNNNVFSAVATHFTTGQGWFLDATSQHNTFNACGAEDWVGFGMEVQGIGNIFNAPWIENRAPTTANDIGMRIANRDNIILAPEIRSADVTQFLAKGIELSAFSANTWIINAHFDNCTQPITLEGTSLFRSIHGVNPDFITDIGNDPTTLVQRGNTVHSNWRHVSAAPYIEYEAENGASGVRHNLIGTTNEMFRWQYNGVTQVQIDQNGDFKAGVANTKRCGTDAIPFLEIHGTTTFSDVINMMPLSAAPTGTGINGRLLAISDGTVDGTFGASGEGLYRLNASGVWVFLG